MSERSLVDFVKTFSSGSNLAVEDDLGRGFVRLQTAEAERRQAKHDIRSVEDIVIELLRNSRDAQASSIYLATGKSKNQRTLTVIDNGVGIHPSMHERIFEPRVTSKLDSMVMDTWGVHGRGMALYSISCNSQNAAVMASEEGLGTSIRIGVNLTELPEIADQSSFPKLKRGIDGRMRVNSGPHNVLRTVVEFALVYQDTLRVYVGSPAEIAARLVAEGRSSIQQTGSSPWEDPATAPIWLRPSLAHNARDLLSICADLGLTISERTAHRVMAGEIKPAVQPLERALNSFSEAIAPQIDIYQDARGLKLTKDDEASFSHSLAKAFNTIGEKYYLQLADNPRIRVTKEGIVVTFPVEKE